VIPSIPDFRTYHSEIGIVQEAQTTPWPRPCTAFTLPRLSFSFRREREPGRPLAPAPPSAGLSVMANAEWAFPLGGDLPLT
jgi:hypothetical protein